MILVARHGFKSNGVYYPMGSVIKDPSKIRFVKSKVSGGTLLPVYQLDFKTKSIIQVLEVKLNIKILDSVTAALATQDKVVKVYGIEPLLKSPQPIYVPIKLTALAKGGTKLQYKWYIGKDNKLSAVTEFVDSNAYTWTPTVPGEYTLKVDVKDTATDKSVDDSITMSYTIVDITTDNSYEEDDSHIKFVGTWETKKDPICSNGARTVTGDTNAKATFSFIGTGLSIQAISGEYVGIVSIELDGAKQEVDCYKQGLTTVGNIYEKTGLEKIKHTVTIAYTGKKNDSSKIAHIGFDKIEIKQGVML